MMYPPLPLPFFYFDRQNNKEDGYVRALCKTEGF